MEQITALEYMNGQHASFEKRASVSGTAAEFIMNNPEFLEKNATWLGTAAKFIHSGIKTIGNKFGKNAAGKMRGDAASASFGRHVTQPLAKTRSDVLKSNFWKDHGGKVKAGGLVAGGMAAGGVMFGSKPQPQARQVPPPVSPIGR
jgi:hypothetical protein